MVADNCTGENHYKLGELKDCMTHLKQVMILNSDLEISRGKQISQACHASLNSYRDSEGPVRDDWEQNGARKIVLEAPEDDLKARFQKAKDEDLPAALVKDAGMTEVSSGTVTAAGIGPGKEEMIDSITGDLRLVK